MKTIFETPNGVARRLDGGELELVLNNQFGRELAYELERLQTANAKLRAACEAALDDLNPNPAYDPNGIKVKLRAALAETAQ